MPSIESVIFDCDGVMFDTVAANKAYYNTILRHFNRPDLTDEQFAFAHMHTADETLAFLFPEEGAREAATAFRKASLHYRDFIPYMKIEPYLIPLLEQVRPTLKTAIVTNRTDTMPGVMKRFKLEGLFDMVVTALDVKRPKPDPEGLEKVLGRFNLPARSAIYIGDTRLDAEAAQRAGVQFAAYGDPALEADYHINSLKEIAPIVGLEMIRPTTAER